MRCGFKFPLPVKQLNSMELKAYHQGIMLVQMEEEKHNSVGDKKFRQASSLSDVKKFSIGMVIVTMIAFSWVGSTQTGKSVYTGSNFRAPFFSMWFGTAWMVMLYPLSSFIYIATKQGDMKKLWKHSVRVFSSSDIAVSSLLSSTVLFGSIWAVTNYMYSRALITMSATDVTALFSSAPAFVFLLSMCILKEPPLILRLGSVILVMCGIILFAYADGFHTANILGVLLSVGSAVGAAVYKVLLKWRIPEASIYQMSLFLSSLGIFSTLFLWPIAVTLHFLNLEVITDVPWTFLCASSALGIVFNFSINFGISYTFPLFISIGTLMGIPINALIDYTVRQVSILNWKFPATDLIIGGFLLMLLPPGDSIYIHKYLTKVKPESKESDLVN